MSPTIKASKVALRARPDVVAAGLEAILTSLTAVNTADAPKTSTITLRYQRLIEQIQELKKDISHTHPDDVKELRQRVLQSLPKFVYYSNYGNLDSEIYLPNVIKNLQRTDLGSKEQAKARTLRVLFEFVRLKPEEILELGKELD